MLKLVRDDIKSLINQIKKTDLRDQVAFNELCYGRRVGDRIYAFCPFCREVVEIDAGQTETQGNRIRLQETANCGCRQGLRYIQLGFLERTKPRKKNQKHPFSDIRYQIAVKGNDYKRTLKSQLAQGNIEFPYYYREPDEGGGFGMMKGTLQPNDYPVHHYKIVFDPEDAEEIYLSDLCPDVEENGVRIIENGSSSTRGGGTIYRTLDLIFEKAE